MTDSAAAAPVAGEPWRDDLEEIPPRRRLRLLTPLTGSLLVVLVASCGFFAGVLVEKGQVSGQSGAGVGGGRRAAALAALAGGAGGGGGTARSGRAVGGQAAGNATIGLVTTIQGRTLYVTGADSNTVQVKIPAGEKISQTISASASAIHPGDTVVVQGARGADGGVTASSVRATSASVAGAGVLGSLFGGGTGTSGSSGAGRTGSGGAVAVGGP